MRRKTLPYLVPLLLLTPAVYYAQQTVTGVIQDVESGYPLGSVEVSVKGTNKKVFSDAKGMYSILAEPKATLVITSPDYQTAEIQINGRQTINIVLTKKEQSQIDEVVIVAFGKQKKRNNIGAQASIKGSEIQGVAVRSVTSLLAGRVAGVVSTTRGGGPGSDNTNLFIRGIASFASSPTAPLLVVDGVPNRSIDNLNPEDIESFTILKDNTATAVYGTQGANGVILITTKRGKAGKPTITAELDFATNRFTKLPDFVDGPTFMRLYNEGQVLRGQPSFFTQEQIEKSASGIDPDLYPNVNWFDEIFRDFGTNKRAVVNMSGGAEAAQYYVSVGYYSETGLFKRHDARDFDSTLRFNRFNFLSNVDIDLTPTTKVAIGINGYITDMNGPNMSANGIFNEVTMSAPHVIPARYSNGMWPQLSGAHASPLMLLEGVGATNTFSHVVRSNLRVTQDLEKLVKGLSATAMFAFDVNGSAATSRTRSPQTYFASGRDAEGNLITTITHEGSNDFGFGKGYSSSRRLYAEAALNYSRTFGKHEVTGMALVNQSDFRNLNPNNYIQSIPERQRSFVFRTTYGYDRKYYFEGNVSIAGSDNFSPSKRYGVFPSVGVGWIVSAENFFKPLKDIVSFMKLRYSYGLSGNASTSAGRFLYLDEIGNGGNYWFGYPSKMGYTGFIEAQIGGDLGWSTSYRHNLGIEMNFLDNDLRLIVDLFKERREGILLRNYRIPYNTGLTTGNIPIGNFGIATNKGIDATLEYNKHWSNSAFLQVRGTFTYNKNKNIEDGMPAWKYNWMDSKGRPIGQRIGYIAEGLFQSEEEISNSAVQSGDTRVGDIRYKDLNGDGVINTFDRARIGYGSTPRLVYGLNIAAGYKNFDISLFFQGAGLVDFNYAGGFATVPFSEGPSYGNMYSFVTDRWMPDGSNPDPFYPRLSTNQTTTMNYVTSTWWIKRADYLRLKQAEIGYTFRPNENTQKTVLFKKLRVYISGTNLFTISKWDFWDPELGDGRGTAYPNTTTYNLGVRLNF